MLNEIPIFQGVPEDGLNELSRQGQACHFQAGAELMHQGEPSTSLHVILTGRVQVERGHPSLSEPLILAELGPGEVVGEMGLLDGEPRSATVRAIEETETIELSRDQVAAIIAQHPETTVSLLRMVSRRLRTTNDLVEEVLRRGGRAST
jgi:CRP/FNR family cyclic AMP-dependent transcriptional regulator